MIEIDEIQIYLGSLIEGNDIIEKKFNLKRINFCINRY